MVTDVVVTAVFPGRLVSAVQPMPSSKVGTDPVVVTTTKVLVPRSKAKRNQFCPQISKLLPAQNLPAAQCGKAGATHRSSCFPNTGNGIFFYTKDKTTSCYIGLTRSFIHYS